MFDDLDPEDALNDDLLAAREAGLDHAPEIGEEAACVMAAGTRCIGRWNGTQWVSVEGVYVRPASLPVDEGSADGVG